MNKILLFFIVCSCSFSSIYAQKNLNDYKYVIVPNRYDFFEEADKYRLNALTKFLFRKHGFDALMADQPYPEDLTKDGCLALRANVIDNKGMLKTKLEVELRDCSNELVFKTKVGISRVKEYKSAYNLALRDAFTSFNTVEYKYSGKKSKATVNSSESGVASVKVETAKEIKEEVPKKEVELTKIDKVSRELEIKNAKTKKKIEKTKSMKTSNDVLYAQATDTGFQVVDSTPKVVMVLLESGKRNTYLVKGKDSVVYEEDGFWYKSEYVNGKLVTNRISIKF